MTRNCDICGKKCGRGYLNYDNSYIDSRKYDVCGRCLSKIDKIIKRFIKEKKNDKKNNM